MAAASAHRRWRSTARLLAGLLALACGAPAASGASDTIAVTLPGAGLPFQMRVAGTAGEAAGMVWVALTPAPPFHARQTPRRAPTSSSAAPSSDLARMAPPRRR